MKKQAYLLFFLLATMLTSMAQNYEDLHVCSGIVRNGDTLLYRCLSEVIVFGYTEALSEQERIKYARLIRNVKKAYPFAKLAGKKLDEYSIILRDAATEKERKRIMKQAENEIEVQFGEELKKLTRRQGVILIKLIDRETGSDSYTLVKELRGSFRAFFYQTFARVFGYNLKSKFDPETNTEDRLIERIIYEIERDNI